MTIPSTLTIETEDLRHLLHYAHIGLALKTGDDQHAARVCTLLCDDVARRNGIETQEAFEYLLSHHDLPKQPQEKQD